MSEPDKAKYGGRRKNIRTDEEKLAGHWLMSFVKNRRRETAAAIIILMLAVAVYDSGDTTEDAASDDALENIEDLLGGFDPDSEMPDITDGLAESDDGRLTIPQHDESGLMDPFDAIRIPESDPAADGTAEYGQPESITAFSNDPIEITPASSRRSAKDSDSIAFDSQSPFEDANAQPETATPNQVRLTGTIEILN